MSAADPHADQRVESAGVPIDEAAVVVVALHGRGATAGGMLDLAREFDRDDVAVLAPQAAGRTWYPNSFLAPIADNEPHLSSALSFVARTVDRARDAGVPADRIVVLGFSQGACLASEFVARNPDRYGGLVVLSGGLIGDTPVDHEGSLDGTPVFLGCSDVDPHIPVERVHLTAERFEAMDGDVTERIYEGMGHGVIPDELDAANEILDEVA